MNDLINLLDARKRVQTKLEDAQRRGDEEASHVLLDEANTLNIVIARTVVRNIDTVIYALEKYMRVR